MRKLPLNSRGLALAVAALMILPFVAGCASRDGESGASLPPIDDTRTAQSSPPAGQEPNKGMSTKTKVAILAGAAALYYMYKKNKEKRAQNAASAPQYYLSKNGRVYYRDANKRAHWVTPPPQGIQVPLDEAQAYRDFQGYNNRPDGRSLVGIGSD